MKKAVGGGFYQKSTSCMWDEILTLKRGTCVNFLNKNFSSIKKNQNLTFNMIDKKRSNIKMQAGVGGN